VSEAAKLGFPVALHAASLEGAEALLQAAQDQRPLLVPPPGSDTAPYAALAAAHAAALVASGSDLTALASAAEAARHAGVKEILLEPLATDLKTLHHLLASLRRGALDRAHPGLGHPLFLRVGPGEIERAALGIVKFASLLTLADHGGETWLPLWTLRQNIYTDPQKPLRMEPAIYPVGEPGPDAPLVVTTNFSLTYFIVSTEIEGTGTPCHLAVVDTEGMSVLTAWAAGKFGGDKVGKALRDMGATEKVAHRTVIIPGYVAVISGELEDALGDGWRVITGPQEASDLAAFFRDLSAA
jgi:acetyl-CoA decarbonylase/synthase complex subunit gamma